VEEANKVSKASWGILIPTVRKEGSEIWITFNPELEEDYTFQRFVLGADLATSVVIKMTWRDNPWFPEVLKKEMEILKKADYDQYMNVWEGHCLQMLEGAVYAKQLKMATEQGRITEVPYDRGFPVDVFWDIGRADNTALWFAQQVAMQVRVLSYFEDHLQDDVSYYLKEIQSRGYLLGTMFLPHDAKARRLGTKKTIEEQIRAAGFRTQIVPNLSLTDGINAARLIFPKCWFDRVGCTDGLQGLRHYRYKIVDGQLSNEPMHNDCADSFRYLAVGIKGPRGSSTASRVLGRLKRAARSWKEEQQRVDEADGRGRGNYQGWMK
jgi:phage terminase large subunit